MWKSTWTKVIPLAVTALLAGGCPDDPPAPGDAGGDIPAETDGGDSGDAADGGDAGDSADTAEVDTGPSDQDKILAINETEQWTIPGLSAPAHVVRVEASIPHIYAANRDDLGRALGFVVARDRWLIMDLQRRLGRGTIAALLGDQALPNDMETRYQGYRDTTQVVFDSLSAEHLSYMTAFCDGVNAYIDYAKQGVLPVPSELEAFGDLLGFTNPADAMVPFEPIDVAAMVAVVMYETNYGTSDPGNTAKRQTYEAGGFYDGAPDEALRYAGAAEIWGSFKPPFEVPSSTEFGVERGTNAPPAGAAGGGNGGAANKSASAATAANKPVNSAMLQRSLLHLARSEARMIRDAEEGFGSNAWAVGGYASSNGMGLVAGDGHLPLSVPALFYQLGLNDTVFGSGDTHQVGMLLTSLPLLAVGTNGKIAWSQVNPVTDNTDWYREELQLDAEGAPQASFFDGQWRDLVAVTETYEIADVPILGSVGRTETMTRYQTFDGRRIYNIEGNTVDNLADVPPGKTAVNIMGDLVVPEDTDGDGKITALSFDWAGFDSAGYVFALDSWGHAESVEDMRVHHTGQIGGGLYTAAADSNGDILYSSYQALPCRGYLPRDNDGNFMPGANPTEVLDGTIYGGFTIPTDGDGLVDEAAGATDPYKCVIPLDATPQAVSPDRGYVVTANNQPGPIMTDGDIFNDPYYYGGPWSSIRAHSIATSLEAAIAAGDMDLDTMAQVQAHRVSRTATMLGEGLIASLETVQTWSSIDGPLDPHQQRAVDTYNTNAAMIDAALTRIKAWRDAGYQTASGVETFYHTPTQQDRDDAVATMIWNAWMPRFLKGTFDDDNINIAMRYSGSRQRLALAMRMLQNRGPGNTMNTAHWNAATEESVFFDDMATVDVERSEEIIVAAMADALDFLSAPPQSGNETGGFGSTDMATWLWGMRHMTRFQSLLADFLGDDPTFGLLVNQFNIDTTVLPLGDDLPPQDPRRSLTWFPRPGDQYGVDAANPGFSGTNFTHGSGPVMRMVIGLKDGEVEGYNIIPGGQSMIRDSPYYADQVQLWLANETLPMRFTVDDVVTGATGRELLMPAN